MVLKKIPTAVVVAAMCGVGAASVSAPTMAEGFNPMKMMNPGKWFGKKDDHGPDGDYPPPPGAGPWGAPYGAPGYGAPPPGQGYGGPAAAAPYGTAQPRDIPGAPANPYYQRQAPAYGAPSAGYYPQAAPGYGMPPTGYPAPGYAAPAAPSYSAPTAQADPSREQMEQRIDELERRLEAAESKQRATPPPSSPPPSSYPYYSGDQTPPAAPAGNESPYPFRPLNLGN